MTASPAGPIDGSLVVASLALLVSILSLAVSFANYKRSGPDVRTHYWIAEVDDDAPKDIAPLAINLSTVNRGVAPVDIGGFLLQRGRRDGKAFRWRVRIDDELALEAGPELPYRLQGGQTKEWTYSIRFIEVRDGKIVSDPSSLRWTLAGVDLFVLLGNGQEIRYRPDARIYFYCAAKWFSDRRAKHKASSEDP